MCLPITQRRNNIYVLSWNVCICVCANVPCSWVQFKKSAACWLFPWREQVLLLLLLYLSAPKRREFMFILFIVLNRITTWWAFCRQSGVIFTYPSNSYSLLEVWIVSDIFLFLYYIVLILLINKFRF